MKKSKDWKLLYGRRCREGVRKMLVFTFSLIAISLQSMATAYSQVGKVSFEVENATLAEIIPIIERSTNYTFLYQDEQVERVKNLTFRFTDEDLRVVLEKCLAGTGLTYQIADNTIVLKGKDADASPALPQVQEHKVSGKVTDESGAPLPGVTVVIEGTTVGVTTDADGNYALSCPEGDIILCFTFVGMEMQRIPITGKSEINVVMKEDVTEYDNVGPNVNNGAENVYSDYTRYDDFRTAVVEKVNSVVSRQNGILQITMDEELMHGATIEITYDVTVTNMGEVDYNETQFYYIGKVNNPETIVRTSADVVIDYVANNLQFRTQSNQDAWDWSTITEQEIQNNNYVNTEVQAVLPEYNTIITTEALNEALIPLTESTQDNEETQDEIQLILTQLITSQNEDDDLTYDNIGEIVQISNDVGRRMAYSVQGNQDPTQAPTEPDSSMAERVVILPPFGTTYLYIGLAVLIAAMLGISIVVIKKTVLNKGRF